MPLFPYIIAVQVKQSDGSIRTYPIVRITNARTGETQTSTGNIAGQVIFDLANFINEYIVGDLIEIEKITSNEFEYYLSANGDETNPTWIEVDSDVQVKFNPNTARIKQNSSKYGGGREVNLTLN